MSIFSAKKWMPAALSAVFLVTSVLPSQAFTPAPSKPVQVQSQASADVMPVQYREAWRDRDGYRGDNDEWRKRRGFYRRGDNAYYNGHRGYRYARPGYRQHNGVWFPLGAFAAGAIIGGALNDRPRQRVYIDPPVRVGNSHVSWCANRYRSYRAYDNSFQPNNGPRRECVSPYS